MILKIVAGLVIALTIFILIARRTSSLVTAERTFNAPVATVWKHWNDPESMKQWWSPKGFTAPVIKSDFRVGGTFLLSMKSPKDEMFWNVGSYKEIVLNKKIVSAMSFSDENGKALRGSEIPVPGVWPDEVTVIVEFTEDGGRTHVKVTEIGIPMIMKLFAKLGWEQQFDKFELLVR